MSLNSSGLAANQLRDVRVFLLRHDRGARTEPIRQIDKIELRTRPNNHLFSHAREVHHGDRCGGRKFDGKVSLDGGVYSGQTGATLTITSAAKADLDGYKFRVKLTSDAGAEEVTSDAATLTYA